MAAAPALRPALAFPFARQTRAARPERTPSCPATTSATSAPTKRCAGTARGHVGPPAAPARTLGIEANGDIKGCPSLPSADYVGENVRDHSLKDIWEQAAELRFTPPAIAPSQICGATAPRDCYYNDVCRAGCTWTGHVLFGRPGNNPFCHHRALELAQAGLVEKLEPVAGRAGRAVRLRALSDRGGAVGCRPRCRSADRDDQGQPGFWPLPGCRRPVVETGPRRRAGRTGIRRQATQRVWRAALGSGRQHSL